MNVWRTVVIAVQHGTSCVLVGLQARECGGLPLLDDGLDLGRGGFVSGRPSDHSTCITPPMPAAIRHLSDEVRVAANYGDFGTFFTVMIVLLEQIAHGATRHSLPMFQELDVHVAPSAPSSSFAYQGNSASRCSSR